MNHLISSIHFLYKESIYIKTSSIPINVQLYLFSEDIEANKKSIRDGVNFHIFPLHFPRVYNSRKILY